MYRMKRDALRGLILALSGVPEKQRVSVLAQWEREVVARGDLERLRAIRDYRGLQERGPSGAIAEAGRDPGASAKG
jgi:hypothetical protein